ncbi:MAG: hypothetical protein JRH08_00780 [Deltaproteobacteria bacterium]|nr:hypothetical protein [Deltaproteobacteria bacterium]MBW2025697.1 hypothetical protein [Deltaproteobacteria bacterium]MBW2124238.1 hypothetical protein [Deltaproteobacteria bacterium]
MEKLNMKLGDIFLVECYDKDGNLKWRDTIKNLVVNEGLNDVLDKYFKGSSYSAAHYCGLTDGTPSFAAGDIMSSHAGWTEVTGYSETTRPQITWGTVSGQSVDNSASKASFSINASVTVGGAFLCTDDAKGGTSGTLYGGGAFSGGDKSLTDGDTLNVQVTATASAS